MYYNQKIEDVLAKLKTDKNQGLSVEEVKRRREQYGENKLEEGKKKTVIGLFLAQLNDPLIYILLIAAVVSAFMNEINDTVIIALVVILNAVIGVTQETKAEKSMEALKQLSTPRAYVKRDGEVTEIHSEEIVPGDIIELDAGRYIPCDIRIIESSSLQIEESALTGESVPVNKNAGAVLDGEKIPLGDQKNMAFSSTLITGGRGVGVAVGTGMNTEIGRIASMLKESDEKTPLQKKLAEIGKMLGIAALVVCIAIFIIGILQKRDVFTMFMTAISLAVAAIPEGMPAIVSIVLAIGVQKMVKKNAIVRKLPAVETLGAVNIICSDKTGTLTQNKMTVQKFYTNQEVVLGGELRLELPEHRLLLENLVLCSDATSNGETSTGDPTEVALIDAGRRYGIEKDALNQEHERVNEVPFDSDRKLMSTLNRYGDRYYVMTKGATDNLLKRSEYALMHGEKVPMTEELRADFMAAANAMSDDALRVLGAAYKESSRYDLTEEEIESALTFIGLTAMIDPPRLEVKDSIDTCKKSGITAVMITGDHQKTAFAIAKELGIAQSESEVMPGLEIDNYSDQELIERVKHIRVFARVSPEHKVRIVKAFKADGNIVSMTGDGVNDAPSLKAADIGVAMGITGTDVAKGAADIVLTDDNFSTIVTAVEEGRNIFNNIKKAINFLLSCNIGEIVALFLSTLFGFATPLQSIHLLWVNLITDSLPALSLGMDPGDKDVMKHKPRNPKEGFFHNRIGFLLLNGLLIGGTTLLAFAVGAMRYSGNYTLSALSIGGVSKETLRHAQTMAFVVLSVSQLFFALTLRSEHKSIFQVGLFKNKFLIGSILLGILLQFLVITVPFLRDVFEVYTLNARDWGFVMLLSLLPFVINEIIKGVKSLFKRK